MKAPQTTVDRAAILLYRLIPSERTFLEMLHSQAFSGIGMAIAALAVEWSPLRHGFLILVKAPGFNGPLVTMHGASLIVGGLLGFVVYAILAGHRLAKRQANPEAELDLTSSKLWNLALILGWAFFWAKLAIGLSMALGGDGLMSCQGPDC